MRLSGESMGDLRESLSLGSLFVRGRRTRPSCRDLVYVQLMSFVETTAILLTPVGVLDVVNTLELQQRCAGVGVALYRLVSTTPKIRKIHPHTPFRAGS